MVLERLAEYSVSLDLAALGRKTTDAACLCLLDAVECMLDSFEDNRTESALKTALQETGNCTLFGRREKSSVRGALLYNTVVGSVASRNDMNIEGNAHPGTALVPLVLAMGEEIHASGKLVLEALVIGYEILSRIGRALRTGNAVIPKALRPTSLCVAIASAFAASKMLGFDRILTCNAAALACNYVAGLNEWRFEGSGEDVYLNAFAAEFGLSCARLTAAGMRASSTNLEGEFGFLSVFNARDNAGMIVADLDVSDAVEKTCHKPVAACRALQSVCLLADRIVEGNAFGLESVSRIEIQVSSRIRNNPWYFRKEKVENLVQAILSIPFGFAATLAAGNHENVKWVPPYESAVSDLMGLTCCTFRDDLGRDSVRVLIGLSDGRTIEETAEGFPAFTAEDITRYFGRRIPACLGKNRTEMILDRFMSVMEIDDISDFTSLFEISGADR